MLVVEVAPVEVVTPITVDNTLIVEDNSLITENSSPTVDTDTQESDTLPVTSSTSSSSTTPASHQVTDTQTDTLPVTSTELAYDKSLTPLNLSEFKMDFEVRYVKFLLSRWNLQNVFF